MRRFLFILMIVSLFIAQPVNAQNEVVLDQLFVKIWPEYDQPEVLVILDLFLASEVNLPARVTMSIPASAGQPHSVAVRELDGMLYLLDYDSRTVGEWTELSFTTPYPEVWIEYYDPALQIDGDTRSYSYEWRGESAVNEFNIEVQQPLTASAMVFQQNLGQPSVRGDGLTYYAASVGAISAKTPLSLQFEYTKTDDTLSSSPAMAVEPVVPVTDQTPGRTSFRQILPWLIAGLGLIIIALGSLWYWQSSRSSAVPARKRHGKSETSRRPVRTDDEDTIYCHQCGKRANPGDLFCRACGTKLKLEE